MSTFSGLLPEFPHIRVDYFRHIPGAQNPLAAFLSHVHSDHLTGLENLKAPFIYCSDTTKQLLLRLERKFHHVNYELGILESRKQQYRHLKTLLKPIPLSTPTKIELAPGNEIQVTLFDANHCPGAVMFLIESDKYAVLYTGDVRAEPWFVNSLVRNPFLIEYTTGHKFLDCIYLDTSFTDQSMTFPTKSEGLSELLVNVAKYPADTVFHFSAWTFGYEEVWMALSKALKLRIHVNKYKLRLFNSLSAASPEGAVLSGYQCGNADQAGILTQNQSVRLHSCEKGTGCTGLGSNTVWIRPIITRTASGREVNEMGIGGGGGDLTVKSELQIGSLAALQQLMRLLKSTDDFLLYEVRDLLHSALQTNQKGLSLDDVEGQESLTVQDLAKLLNKQVAHNDGLQNPVASVSNENLPKVVTFPYSRHSSYAELCHLVDEFQPKQIYPCTVEAGRWHGYTVETLFGRHCSERTFRHDLEMREFHMDRDTDGSSQVSGKTSSNEGSPLATGMPRNLTSPIYAQSISPSFPQNATSDTDTGEADTSGRPGFAHIPRGSEDNDGVSGQRKSWKTDPSDHIFSSDGHCIPDSPSLGPATEGVPAIFWDSDDNISRCGRCGWEFFRALGECSSQNCHNKGPLHIEDNIQNIISDDEMEDDWQLRQTGFSESLDALIADESDRSTENDEYEESFIDDASIYSVEVGGLELDLSEVDRDNEKLPREPLQRLEPRIENVADDCSSFRPNVSGSDFNASDEDLMFCEESGLGLQPGTLYQASPGIPFVVVDVEMHDPALTEIIANTDSQASALSESRIADRVAGFEAALNNNGNGCNIPLISVNDNHTTAEVEL